MRKHRLYEFCLMGSTTPHVMMSKRYRTARNAKLIRHVKKDTVVMASGKETAAAHVWQVINEACALRGREHSRYTASCKRLDITQCSRPFLYLRAAHWGRLQLLGTFQWYWQMRQAPSLSLCLALRHSQSSQQQYLTL